MNPRKNAIRSLGCLLILSMTACQPDQTEKVNDANSSPSPPLPSDTGLGHGYVRRDGAIHFIGGGTTGTGANATRIDTPSPRLLKKAIDSKLGPFKTAEGLDVPSFEVLSGKYTRDKNRVYYKIVSPGEFLVIVLPDADPTSFELLTDNDNVARDDNNVWFYDKIVAGVDPSTMELIEDGPVFKDKDSVHYQHRLLAGADPASFKHLDSAYYADKKRVYWGPDPIPDADLDSFEVLGGSFVAKDRNRVYRSGEQMTGLDVDTTQLLLHDPAGHQFLSDKNGIHLGTMPFPRSKPGKTRIIDHLTVKAGDLVLVVNTYQTTPVTLFKEDGKVMAETLAYEPASRKPMGTVTAVLTETGLKNIKPGPLPDGSETPSVPDWQIKVFKQPAFIRQMLAAAKHLN